MVALIDWKLVGSSLVSFLSIASDAGTVAATMLAFWIFLSKRKELVAFVRAVSNFALQDSLQELKQLLVELHGLDAARDPQKVKNIFYQVCGQLDGNPMLRERFASHIETMKKANKGARPITEHRKIELISSLRESLKYINADASARLHVEKSNENS